jgi:hypothetical protein
MSERADLTNQYQHLELGQTYLLVTANQLTELGRDGWNRDARTHAGVIGSNSALCGRFKVDHTPQPLTVPAFDQGQQPTTFICTAILKNYG